MPNPVEFANPSSSSEYTFIVTRSEPGVNYWQDKNEGEFLDRTEKVNVPRAHRRLLRGLEVPIKDMFSVDYIPVQVHVDPGDIAAGLRTRNDPDERGIEYWEKIASTLAMQTEETLVSINADAGELYLTSEL